MTVLIIGGGGREHALAAAIAKDGAQVFVAPGNGGIAREFKCLPLTDLNKVLDWCLTNQPNFVVFGPEQPLADGWVDVFEKAGVPCVGPTAQAAKIESSKAFAKELMAKNKIPTASYECFDNPQEAQKHILSQANYPIVIKADGLAAGKGVAVVENEADALNFLESISGKVVLEEFLVGWETSLFAITDGENFQTTLFARDHKRLNDGDQGPNTGGMGAFCPVPEAEKWREEIENNVISPTLKALRDLGSPFRGFLYCGLMITEEGPKVLEYNCRLGDPETQALLPLLNTSFIEICEAVTTGTVGGLKLDWSDQSSVCVIMSSQGYPGSFNTGHHLDFSREIQSLIRFGGVKEEAGRLVSSGGRVLSLVALGDNLAEAREKVYGDLETIDFSGKHFRKDIALPRNQI